MKTVLSLVIQVRTRLLARHVRKILIQAMEVMAGELVPVTRTDNLCSRTSHAGHYFLIGFGLFQRNHPSMEASWPYRESILHHNS